MHVGAIIIVAREEKGNIKDLVYLPLIFEACNFIAKMVMILVRWYLKTSNRIMPNYYRNIANGK